MNFDAEKEANNIIEFIRKYYKENNKNRAKIVFVAIG